MCSDKKAEVSDDKKRPTLAARIRNLLSAEFERLAPSDAAGVLAAISTELQQMSEAGVSSISEMSRTANPVSEAWQSEDDPVLAYQEDGSVEVSTRAKDTTARLINEILNVGAVMLDLDPLPELNKVVEVRFRFPEYHLDFGTRGRVVHASAKGCAIEMSHLDKEDRAAIEGLWPDIQAAAEAPEAEEESDQDGADFDEAFDDKKSSASQTTQAPAGVKASDSVPVPSLGRRPETQFRRRVDLTNPDVKVISSTQMGIKAVTTRELYGPAIPKVDPSGEFDREEALAEERILDIFLQLSQDGTTGMVELVHESADAEEPIVRQILLDSGFVVEISREPRNADEELGPMLHRADRITKQQLSMSAAHADEHDGTIERSLLDLGILDPDRIRQSIAGRLTYLIREMLSLTDGELRIYQSSALPAGFLPAPPLRVHVAVERIAFKRLYETYRQKPLKERESLANDYLEAYPEVVPEELERVERTLTEDSHSSLLEKVVNGRRRLKEVFTESTLGHAETFALVHSLHRMGLIRYDRSLHQTVVRERFRENVTVKYLSVHKASYFEVLNVHWSSYDDAIKKAYEELKIQFNPDEVPENMEADVHKRVGEIRDRVESAYQVLARRDTRHAYRKRVMPEYKLEHAIPLFMKQSELAERRQQWKEARDASLRVLEIAPDNEQAAHKIERIEAILDNRLSPDATESNF